MKSTTKTHRLVTAAVALAGVLTFGACGGDDKVVDLAPPAAPATTETPPPPTTLPAPPPSSVPAAPSGSVGQPIAIPHTASFLTCPSSPSPGYGTWNNVDFNGDGVLDNFRAYTVGGAWRVALEEGATSYDDEPLITNGTPVFPQGGADVNSDGREEGFIAVGPGVANTTAVGLYVLVGSCDIQRVYDEGQPAVFFTGASATDVYGVKCMDATGDGITDILQYHGTNQGSSWLVTTGVVDVTPQAQYVPKLSPPSLTTTNPGPYAGFDCGPLTSLQTTG